MKLRVLRCVCAIVFLLLSGFSLFAQTAATGALTGTVTDPSGAVIAGAMVTVTNNGTGQSRTAMTGADGVYKVNLLPPGSYDVKFEAAGFSPVEVPAVEIVVTETPVLDRSLTVGSTNQEVTVQANVETIQTASSTVGTVIGSSTVTDLPLSTRNYVNLISLSAGANSDVTNATQLGKGFSLISVNGASSTENNFQQDGVPVDNWASWQVGQGQGFFGANPVPNPDAIQEFKIQTSNYDAGYGRNPGANVNVVTRSGTNGFHGSLFEFLRNTALDANEFFYKRSELLRGAPNQQAVFNQDQYGGVLGGPIKKDKVFFFVSYQETQQKNGLNQFGFSTAFLPPIPTGNRGNCAAANGGNPNWTTCADPAGAAFIAALGADNCPAAGKTLTLHGGTQVACNGSNINPVAINILQLKLANGGYYVPSPATIPAAGQTVQSTYSDPATYKEHQLIANTDFVLNSKNTLSTRSFLEDDPTNASFVCFQGGPCLPGGPMKFKYPNDADVLKLTTLLTSNVVNEARVSFQRNVSISQNEIPFTNAQVGINGLAPVSAPELAQIQITNTFYIGGAPYFGIHLTDNQWEAADQISWVKGRHSFRAGAEFEHYSFTFSGASQQELQIGASTFADFLIGRCANLAGCANSNGTAFSNLTLGGTQLRAFNGTLASTFLARNANAFFQDDIKVNSRLTLNLGLRWEWDGFPKVESGENSEFWPSVVGVQPIPGSTPATGSLVGYVVPSNWSGGALPAGVFQSNHGTLTQSQAPLDDFAPRVGFAWTPLGGNLGGRFVVRGGAGFFYNMVSGPILTGDGLVNEPYALTLGTNPLGTFANPAVVSPTIPGPAGTPGWLPRYVNFATNVSSNIATSWEVNPNLTVPASYEWNLETQYEFLPSWVLEVGYVGSRGIHQSVGYYSNSIGGATSAAIPLNVPRLASASSPLYCGYDGVATDCVTTNSAANAVVRVPDLGIISSWGPSSTTGDYKFNSAQVTVRKNMSHGLQLQAAYTYSRSFVNYWVGNPAAIAPGIPGVVSEYGPNGTLHPNRLTVNYAWDLPFGKHEGFLGAVLSGWNWSGVTTIQDGAPLTFTSSTTGTVFASLGVNMAVYCPGMGRGNIASSGSTEARVVNGLTGGTGWINPGVFAGQASSPTSCTVPSIPAALGSGTVYGNAGLGQILGPGQNNWDMALAKVTRVGGLSEGATLQIRAEFFNTWNHPQFNDPAVNTSLSSLGQVSASSVNPRLMQFGIKYVF